jgi:hypothetical protein
MFERESKLCGFATTYCRKLVQDIPEEQLAVQPAPGMNHPAWVLGHLAVVGDSGLRMLGQPAQCPREWRALFGMGSQPGTDRAAYPTCEALLGRVESIYGALRRALQAAPRAVVEAPHSAPFFKDELPLVADLIAHIMTTHFASHLGQISAWRRTQGLAGVLGL